MRTRHLSFGSPRALARLVAVGLLILQSACGNGGGGGGGDDELESAILAGLDDPQPITEAELDQEFPLVEPTEPAQDEELTQAVDGGTLETRFAAYVPSRTAAGLFTMQVADGVPQDVVDRTSRGILFGLEHFQALLPGFDVYAAAAARPFTVHLFTQADPTTGFRPYVKACPNKPADYADYAGCIPEVFIPHAVVDGVASPVAAGSFVHEIGHLGHVYYTLSAAHTKAGGIILGAFRHNEMRWQREGSAQFLRARAPDWAAYDRLGASACAFDALRQGAFKWKDFAPVGAAMVHPYQMSLLVDQVSWFHYKGGTDWLLGWWVARPDARDKTRPESAARALMRLLSPTAPVVDLSSLNLLLGRAAVDLAVRGRNPWTTRALNLECFDRGTIPISATAPGSVSVSVPPLAFRLATIPFELLAAQALDTLEIRLQTSQPAVRAAVYLIDVPGYVACVNALTGTALGEESPRKECNAKHVSVVGKLQAENGYKATLKVTDANRDLLESREVVALVFHPYTTGAARTDAAVTLTAGPPAASDLTVTFDNTSSEDHVHFEVTAPSYVAVTAYRGSPQTGVVSGVKAGDEIAVNVKKPSDSGPVSSGSTTCKVSDAPSSPRITYSGSLRCSGF